MRLTGICDCADVDALIRNQLNSIIDECRSGPSTDDVPDMDKKADGEGKGDYSTCLPTLFYPR